MNIYVSRAGSTHSDFHHKMHVQYRLTDHQTSSLSLVSRWWAHGLVFQVTQEKNWALMCGRYTHAKPVLDIVQSRLAKYLWPHHHAPSGYRYSHAFDKSFFGHSTSPSPAVWRSSPKRLKWPKLTTQCIWLAGQLMTSQPRLATVLEETPLTCGKWKRKWHNWLRMRLKFLLNLFRHQNTVRPIQSLLQE